jgi:hypothetical protein
MKIFINSLKLALTKLDKKNIGFVGVINPGKEDSHDVDVLIFPSKNAKLGESLISVMKLYNLTNKILKKNHKRYYIAPCPRKVIQEMVYYLSSLEEGGSGLIPVHSLFFPNYKSFKKFNPPGFENSIKKHLVSLYGKYDLIKELPIFTDKVLDVYFTIIDFEMNVRIRNFPKYLVRSSAESLFSYLRKKLAMDFDIELKAKQLHDVKDIEKEFIILLRSLDKKIYSK